MVLAIVFTGIVNIPGPYWERPVWQYKVVCGNTI